MSDGLLKPMPTAITPFATSSAATDWVAGIISRPIATIASDAGTMWCSPIFFTTLPTRNPWTITRTTPTNAKT